MGVVIKTRAPLQFVLAFHNHQPVGNFDHVFQEAFDQSYKPFLDVFEATKSLKISFHITGPLYDWLEANEPKYLTRLARLVKQGRVELLGGGFYEPLLSLMKQQVRMKHLRVS